MAANIPDWRVVLDDGTDLTDKISPRLLELTLTEKREAGADELTLSLHNADGKLAVPATGRKLTLSLGWASGDDVAVGLVEKGSFVVDEVEEGGPPDRVTIRARSADLSNGHSRRRNRIWHNTTLGAVLSAIAARHSATASVHPDLAAQPIEHLEQANKSDVALVQDLGRRFDALATWKGGKLVFMPIGSTTNASGQTLPSHTITRNQGWGWRFQHAKRDAQNGAQAQYHDPTTGRRRTVATGGNNPHRLKRIYSSHAEATRAAASSAKRRQRGAYSFDYDLALADCTLRPNLRVALEGWSATVTSIKWLIESVETSMGAGGMKQRIRMESA
ncbi:phage late control D family protein [Novosphingobium umbonatum]|uniref:Phage late control D family protein n=1 Tax=Novosphingobium umbonatum TaxID=1908524 RepID=A0A437N1X3_9SPHN|nr:contractile injection system protein, VgrG/Pvc8 family [Novosphingobium umbonatum]RVU03917.1 phage late control D family protein [Novosphingobium umbonatum]